MDGYDQGLEKEENRNLSRSISLCDSIEGQKNLSNIESTENHLLQIQKEYFWDRTASFSTIRYVKLALSKPFNMILEFRWQNCANQ